MNPVPDDNHDLVSGALGSDGPDIARVLKEMACPRSSEVIERVAGPMRQQIQRRVRTGAALTLSPLLVLFVLFGWYLAAHGGYTRGAAAFIACTLFFFCSIPVVLCLNIWQHESRTIMELLRDAPAYSGQASLRNWDFLVEWPEHGTIEEAFVKVPYQRRDYRGEVAVFAKHGVFSVLVLLDNGELYVSTRESSWPRISGRRSKPIRLA